MAGIDDILIPKLILDEGAAPATPAAGTVVIYAKADGLSYSKDDAGVEKLMSTGSLATPTHHGCSAVRTTNQTGVVTVTLTDIVFNGTDDFDTDGYHDPAGANPERITIPAGLGGYYRFATYLIWDTNATGYRRISFLKNGSILYSVSANAVAGTINTQQTVSWPTVSAVATDYFSVQAFHNSGGDRTLQGVSVPLRFTADLLGV